MKVQIFHSDTETGKTYSISASVFVSRGRFVAKARPLGAAEGTTYYLNIPVPENPKLYNKAFNAAKDELVRVWCADSRIGSAYDKTTFAEAWEKFEKLHLKFKKLTTIKNYALSYRRIITPEFVNLEITRRNIEAALSQLMDNRRFTMTKFNLREGELSDTAINDYMRQFRVFLKFCLERGFLSENFDIMKVFKLKPPPKPIQIYTHYELKQIKEYFQNSDSEFLLLIEFLLNSGARIREALALKRTQILDDRIFFGNKITSEFESVPLSEALKSIVNRAPGSETLYRWSYESVSFLRKKLKSAMFEKGIEPAGRCFHTFRKTFLFHLFESGTPVEVAQRLMRHKNIDVTIKHYTYFDMEILKRHLDNKNADKKRMTF